MRLILLVSAAIILVMNLVLLVMALTNPQFSALKPYSFVIGLSFILVGRFTRYVWKRYKIPQ